MQLYQLLMAFAKDVLGRSINAHSLAFREVFTDPFQNHQKLFVGKHHGISIRQEDPLHSPVGPPCHVQILQHLVYIPDPELLILIHAAKGAQIMGAADGYLHDQAVGLAGRPENISLVSHGYLIPSFPLWLWGYTDAYMLSGAFMPKSPRPFFRTCLTPSVKSSFAFCSSARSERICSSW